jgi:Uma2 family endonuclease
MCYIGRMNVTLRIPTSLDGFLAWEERRKRRYEFDGVRAVAMVGGTWRHGQICLNIALALRMRLQSGCAVTLHDTKLRLAGSIRYPDVMVVCGPVRNAATFVTNPVVVFEVLSERTSVTDRLVKSREYGEAPSIVRYVIVEQTGIGATMFERPDWRGQPLVGAETVLTLPEIAAEVRLGDFYAGVEFDAESDAESGTED